MKNSTELNKAIETVFQKLKSREVHPTGKFDEKKRFTAFNADLINVRPPSKKFPFSEMVACRTKKYVKAVAVKFNAQTEADLLANI